MTKLPNISEAIGKNIRNARLFKRLTTKELAELSGLSPGHLQMLETGRRRINVDHLFAIGKALGVTPEKLINPDITSYFPSQRTLPLVNMAALDNFSDCPDKESVERIADKVCLCPPQVTDSRAFAVQARYGIDDFVGFEERFGIVICVPSSPEEIPYAYYEPPATPEVAKVITVDKVGTYLERPLVKISGHPVYFRQADKWQSQGRNFLTIYLPGVYASKGGIMTAALDQKSEPFVLWVCRAVGHYPELIVDLVSTPTRPRKEK